jgi:hypothetical protein
METGDMVKQLVLRRAISVAIGLACLLGGPMTAKVWGDDYAFVMYMVLGAHGVLDQGELDRDEAVLLRNLHEQAKVKQWLDQRPSGTANVAAQQNRLRELVKLEAIIKQGKMPAYAARVEQQKVMKERDSLLEAVAETKSSIAAYEKLVSLSKMGIGCKSDACRKKLEAINTDIEDEKNTITRINKSIAAADNDLLNLKRIEKERSDSSWIAAQIKLRQDFERGALSRYQKKALAEINDINDLLSDPEWKDSYEDLKGRYAKAVLALKDLQLFAKRLGITLPPVEVPPMANPQTASAPPAATPSPTPQSLTTRGWFEGATGTGELTLTLEGQRVTGNIKGNTMTVAVVPANGARTVKPDGRIVVSGQGADGQPQTATWDPNEKTETIQTSLANGCTQTTVRESSGFGGEYRENISLRHATDPNGHCGTIETAGGNWDQIRFDGRVVGGGVNGESISGTLEGRWSLSTEYCGSNCGPTSGKARAEFKGRIAGDTLKAVVSWTLMGVQSGKVVDTGNIPSGDDDEEFRKAAPPIRPSFNTFGRHQRTANPPSPRPQPQAGGWQAIGGGGRFQ